MNEIVQVQVQEQPQSERRAFGIHPAILLTLMREQGGTIDRAMAELVMNSVDAGATEINITISEEGFTFKDDGQGFSSRDQIENFFEIFGTPHKAGDAYYGKFRIGRGQIMSYASTNWRSGWFEMKVDITGESSDLGYELVTHPEKMPGCRIEGRFSGKVHINGLSHNDDYYDDYYRDGDFIGLVRFVPIPIIVNGKQLNKPPATAKWDMEDDFAWYRFEPAATSCGLSIYNCGVFVERLAPGYFGIGGTVVSKKPLTVNLARNAIIKNECETWFSIKKVMDDRFDIRLSKVKHLSSVEADKLLCDLLFSDAVLGWDRAEQIRKIRFIPDIFGELQSPDNFLASHQYTKFDGKHNMIAERVQRQKLASVLMPAMCSRLNLEDTDDNYLLTINILRRKLKYDGVASWVPFEQYVKELSATSELLDDNQLTEEELLALSCLRLINDKVAKAFVGDRCKARRIVAGKSDTAEAWTDGSSFIAINHWKLRLIKGGFTYQRGWRNQFSGSQAYLIALLAHEYAHTDSTAGNHSHDYGFYQRFHESVLKLEFGTLADTLQRKYIAGMSKVYINPSAPIRTHIKQIIGHAAKFKAKGLKKPRAVANNV